MFVSAEASECTSGHPVFTSVVVLEAVYQAGSKGHIVQELYESRGGRPGLYVLTSLLASVDVKLY